jgi:hypothetical protein
MGSRKAPPTTRSGADSQAIGWMRLRVREERANGLNPCPRREADGTETG